MRVEVAPGPPELAEGLAARIVEAAVEAVSARGRFTLGLAGGSTPLAAYRLLGRGPLSAEMPWAGTVLLWGDERCVPPEDEHSNAGAAMAALGPSARPAEAHPIPAELGPDQGASRYAEVLAEVLCPGPAPVIDLVLLGLGQDGHTASLLPGSAALEVRDRAVAGVPAPEHVAPRLARVTLTLPALGAARAVVFAVSGEGKAAVLRRVVEERDQALPAARLVPSGELIWLLDEAAATRLRAGRVLG